MRDVKIKGEKIHFLEAKAARPGTAWPILFQTIR